jgi:hypothetical protein
MQPTSRFNRTALLDIPDVKRGPIRGARQPGAPYLDSEMWASSEGRLWFSSGPILDLSTEPKPTTYEPSHQFAMERWRALSPLEHAFVSGVAGISWPALYRTGISCAPFIPS